MAAVGSFIKVLQREFLYERNNVLKLVRLVYDDCVDVRNSLSDAVVQIRTRVKKPLAEVISVLQLQLLKDFTNMKTLMEKGVEIFEPWRGKLVSKNGQPPVTDYYIKFNCDHKDGNIVCSPDFKLYEDSQEEFPWPEKLSADLARVNHTVWNMYTRVASNIKYVTDALNVTLRKAFHEDILSEEIKLKTEYLESIAFMTQSSCIWCDDPNANLSRNIHNKLTSHLWPEADHILQHSNHNLQILYENCLKDMQVVNNTESLTVDCFHVHNNISDSLSHLLEMLTNLSGDCVRMETSLVNLGEYIWSYSCQSEMSRIAASYDDTDQAVCNQLSGTYAFVTDQKLLVDTLWQDYLKEAITLITAGRGISFQEVQSKMITKTLALDTLLTEKQQSVKNVQQQIAKINYLMAATIDYNHLEQNARYWQQFHVQAQTMQMSLTQPSEEAKTPFLPLYEMLPNTEEAKMWEDISANIRAYRTNSQIQTDILVDKLKQAESFFYEFVASNTVDDTFFR